MFIPYRFLLFYTNATITLYKILACINITDINHSIHEALQIKKSAENSKNSFNFPTAYLFLFNPHAEVKFP